MEGENLPTGPKFARVVYALLGVAVLAALLKLGDISGAKPLILRTVPTRGEIRGSGNLYSEVPTRTSLVLPDTEHVLERTRAHSVAFVDDVPGFYRPSPEPVREEDEPVCGDLDDFPESNRAVFPLPEACFNSYEDISEGRPIHRAATRAPTS